MKQVTVSFSIRLTLGEVEDLGRAAEALGWTKTTLARRAVVEKANAVLDSSDVERAALVRGLVLPRR